LRTRQFVTARKRGGYEDSDFCGRAEAKRASMMTKARLTERAHHTMMLTYVVLIVK
jgi:hypothetical protein